MNTDLSVLTEKQREVYLAREKGESYTKIANRMGCRYSNARQHYVAAVRRLQAQEKYNSMKEKNSAPVDLTLTLGELKVARIALECLKGDIEREQMRRKPENQTPSYEYDTAVQLIDKIRKAIIESNS